mgnify:CR=1 FL=1
MLLPLRHTNNFDYLNCKSNPLVNLFYPFDIKPKLYPETLKELEFCCDFNQPVDNLPTNLLKIEFGSAFNQPVDNLPANLIKIEFVEICNGLLQELFLSELTQCFLLNHG